MPILYGARGTGSSIVEAACAELGIAIELCDLDARALEHRGDAHAARNPHRKMPAIELDGGEILTETVAILLTLDERHPARTLLPPAGSRARAQALRWMLFMATELYPIVEIIDFPQRFAPGAEATDDAAKHRDVAERAKEMWRERWRVIDSQIVGPFLLGSDFCATDIYVAALCHWDLEDAWRREHLPRVVELAAAVRARPAIGPVWDRHFPLRSPS